MSVHARYEKPKWVVSWDFLGPVYIEKQEARIWTFKDFKINFIDVT
jgi:hypothetical protein